MNINIEIASIEQKAVIKHLFQLYQYDISKFLNDDVNEQGLYEYKYFDHYWIKTTRMPFLITIDKKYAGFALIREIIGTRGGIAKCYSIAEFFVMKKYRKNGIGKNVAFQLFEHLQGGWEVSVMEVNTPAQHFWRKVISSYTNYNYDV